MADYPSISYARVDYDAVNKSVSLRLTSTDYVEIQVSGGSLGSTVRSAVSFPEVNGPFTHLAFVQPVDPGSGFTVQFRPYQSGGEWLTLSFNLPSVGQNGLAVYDRNAGTTVPVGIYPTRAVVNYDWGNKGLTALFDSPSNIDVELTGGPLGSTVLTKTSVSLNIDGYTQRAILLNVQPGGPYTLRFRPFGTNGNWITLNTFTAPASFTQGNGLAVYPVPTTQGTTAATTQTSTPAPLTLYVAETDCATGRLTLGVFGGQGGTGGSSGENIDNLPTPADLIDFSNFPTGSIPSSINLTNGQIDVKLAPAYGGSVYWLSDAGSSVNLINNPVLGDGLDETGRQVQTALYASPKPFTGPSGSVQHEQYENSPYNALEGGDAWHDASSPSQWVAYGTRTQTINGASRQVHYLKVRGKLWVPKNTPSDVWFEKWFWLEGKVLAVQQRVIIERTDVFTGTLEPHFQEMPCVYLRGDFKTGFVTQNGQSQQINFIGASEKNDVNTYTNDVAILKNGSRAVGIMAPAHAPVIFQYFGNPAATSFNNDSVESGYMAINPYHIWGMTDQHTWSYRLILGNNETEVRQLAAGQPRPTNVPRYLFNPLKNTRQSWLTYFCSDKGVSAAGWRVSSRMTNGNLNTEGTNLAGPHTHFSAALAPKLYVKVKATNVSSLRLYFAKSGQSQQVITYPNETAQYVQVPVTGDGAFRVYELNMAGHASWNGNIARLWLSFPGSAEQDITLKFVSTVNEETTGGEVVEYTFDGGQSWSTANSKILPENQRRGVTLTLSARKGSRLSTINHLMNCPPVTTAPPTTTPTTQPTTLPSGSGSTTLATTAPSGPPAQSRYLRLRARTRMPGYQTGTDYYYPCSQVGLTPEECFREMADRLWAIVDTLPAEGQEVPCPSDSYSLLGVICARYKRGLEKDYTGGGGGGVDPGTTAAPTTQPPTTLSPLGPLFQLVEWQFNANAGEDGGSDLRVRISRAEGLEFSTNDGASYADATLSGADENYTYKFTLTTQDVDRTIRVRSKTTGELLGVTVPAGTPPDDGVWYPLWPTQNTFMVTYAAGWQGATPMNIIPQWEAGGVRLHDISSPSIPGGYVKYYLINDDPTPYTGQLINFAKFPPYSNVSVILIIAQTTSINWNQTTFPNYVSHVGQALIYTGYDPAVEP